MIDAYDIAESVKKHWADLHPKNSGEINKPRQKIKVVVYTPDGYREVVGVFVKDHNTIELRLDGE